MSLPFRIQAGAAASQSGPAGEIPAYRDTTQGEAPEGVVFSESELPVHAGTGSFREGFSPSGGQAPLPAPGSDTGFPLPPTGTRR
jgi:hypothetical protein